MQFRLQDIDPGKTQLKKTRDRKGYDYKNIAMLGKGSYGQVYLFQRQGSSSKNVFTQFFFQQQQFDDQYCAIKKYKLPDSQHQGVAFSTLRQINFMLGLKHPNIVIAHQIFSKNQVVNVVMDFNLELEEILNLDVCQNKLNKKILCHHIAKGLAYLHKHHVMHRDLKPQNIFIGKKGSAKIGDFGLSKQFGTPRQKLTPEVCTIYYRAPQLFFKTFYYTEKTDVWALGCIFFYIFTNQHLFICNSTSQVSVLSKIFSITGVPNEKTWKKYAHFPKTFIFQPFEKRPLSKQKSLDLQLAHLIEWCLELDPCKRPSAQQILQHPFFKNDINKIEGWTINVEEFYNKKLEKLLQIQ